MPNQLAQVFRRELCRESATTVGALTPTDLSRAAARALRGSGATGAGLTLLGAQLPVPLGASDPEVMRAEVIQATLGEGPCLDAARRGCVVVVDQDGLSRSWPVYHDQLLTQTSLRSVVALPLGGEEGVFAALDVYSRGSAFTDLPPLEELSQGIGDLVGAVLLSTAGGGEDPGTPDEDSLADSARYRARIEVWRAVATVMAVSELSNDDALALLRGYALGHDLTIDELGQQLLAHEVSTADVLEA